MYCKCSKTISKLSSNTFQKHIISICLTKDPNLSNIEYNYCICVYIYPEEFFKSNNRDYSMLKKFISGQTFFPNS